MEEKIKLTVEINKKDYENCKKLVNYINTYNKLHRKEAECATVEKFIAGSLNKYVEYIETFNPHIISSDDPNEVNNNEGKLQNRLKDFLKERKIKQVELAKLTNIDEATISLIMKNRNQPSIDHFLRIWFALGQPPIGDIFYRVSE